MSDFTIGDSFFTPILYNNYPEFMCTMINKCESTKDEFSLLKLVVTNKDLIDVYKEKVKQHNANFKEKVFMDSGFDLFVPQDHVFNEDSVSFDTQYVNLGVKAELIQCKFAPHKIETITSAFYLYPRSSMSKTPLMMANHTGIIDSGYRGDLIVALRCLDNKPYTLKEQTRLVQICDPKLKPIYVVLVEEDELSTTERGEGGFGSTGV